MPYRYLDDVATADVAFEATGNTLEELFVASAEATMKVMVDNLETIEDRERRPIRLSSDAVDMLLFDFLQELIFHKDAGRLILRVPMVTIERGDGEYRLVAEGAGETIDTDQHLTGVDVKAVTLHRFRVEETPQGWRASVVLDI